MRDLFGNPAEGSFLAWLADKGVWAALIVIGSALLWYILHRLSEAWISRTLKRLEDNWLLGDLVKQESIFRWLDEVIIGVLIGVPAVIGLLDVLGMDIKPVLVAIEDAWRGARPWLTDHGIKIVLVLIVGWVARGVLGRALPRLLTRAVLRTAYGMRVLQAGSLHAYLAYVIVMVVSLVLLVWWRG